MALCKLSLVIVFGWNVSFWHRISIFPLTESQGCDLGEGPHGRLGRHKGMNARMNGS